MNTKSYISQTLVLDKNLTSIMQECKKFLTNEEISKPYVQYLDQRINKKSQIEYQFGFFPASKDISLFKDVELLKKVKLCFEAQNGNNLDSSKFISFFEHHNLVFPILDDFGHIVGITGRTLLSDEERLKLSIDKYKNHFFKKSQILFGLDKVKEVISSSQKVILVEGQLDCITCHSKGFYNVVGLGGPSLSLFQLFLLRKYGGPNIEIFLLLDNDLAGREGTEKIIKKWGHLAKFQAINVPSTHKDIDSYLRETNDVSFLAQF